MAESEAETPSTPGEFESKYFEFHGVRLPPFCRGKMEEIANFPVRPSDVWIVTYPKSGEPAQPPPAGSAARPRRSCSRRASSPGSGGPGRPPPLPRRDPSRAGSGAVGLHLGKLRSETFGGGSRCPWLQVGQRPAGMESVWLQLP